MKISFWERSTNPYKRLSEYEAEMRGNRTDRTGNRLELTIIFSSELKCERWAEPKGECHEGYEKCTG